MKRYCIIPKNSRELFGVLDNSTMNISQKELFYESIVRHIEISPETHEWEIVFETKKLIEDDLLDIASSCIEKKCCLSKVTFHQKIVSLEAAVELNWDKLVGSALNISPVGRQMLLECKRYVENDGLEICVFGGLAAEFLHTHDVAKNMQTAVEKLVGVRCAVHCRAVEDAHNEEIDVDKTIYQTSAYREALSTDNHKAKEQIKGKNGADKKGNINADKSLIYGSDVNGEVTAIAEVKDESKNIVFAGTVVTVSGKELKSTNILFVEIADNTDGISCKAFFKDKEEYNEALSKITPGLSVRVKGKVAWDDFLNDMTMMISGISLAEKTQRSDNSPEKRVELHAHTWMSALDAVVSVKKLISTAASWGMPAIAITDHGVVQAFPDAQAFIEDSKADIKVIYGMEGYLVEDDFRQKSNHIILLAKNLTGLHNLYRLVSVSHIRTFHRQPRIPKKLLSEFRDGIIVGSACEAGELVRAIVAGKDDEELLKIADFYDYLEIQPIGNNEFLKRSEKFPEIQTDDDLRNINLKVAELANKLGKMLIATCDVHFLNPEDSIYRAVIMAGNGFPDAEFQPPLFLRTTEEMLKEFDYLGEKLAYEAVVTNTRKIADMVEVLKPIPFKEKLYSPEIPGAADIIQKMSYDKAHQLYGDNLPKVVQERIDLELKPITEHGFSSLYLIAHKLVKKSNLDGYLVGSRGSVGSSFIATLTDITEVNPLPPHWRCPHCRYSKFVTDGSYSSGFDLPDMVCPVCDTPLLKDGHEIPFAVFLGFNGEKVPDIDLNFSGDYQPVAHKYTEELFGKDNVYRAGTIQAVKDKTAYGYVKKFFEDKGLKKRNPYINNIVKGCLGTKRTTGQHPAGIMVLPRNMDIHFFSPIQHPANKAESGTVTTHFDYTSLHDRLVKLDILGHDDPTIIKMLEDLTNRDPKSIPFDDKATTSLFYSTEALGVTAEELGATSGTFGIPEFRTEFTRQMIDDTHPDCFSDLVRISGFSHGTDVWLGNAQDLIRGGTTTLKNAISARDDIMVYLIHKGVDPLLAFSTMENVRKGKGIKPDVIAKLKENNVPDWYVDSCNKIKYLFPRAHATAYVMMAYRIAFCKVHYPLAFYAAYFSIRANAFDVDIVAAGKEAIKSRLAELLELEHPNEQEKEHIIVLQLAWEMYLRGYCVEHVNLYESEAEKFIIKEKSLLPPLNSLGGLGDVAARSIAEARKASSFSSVADIRKRTGISQVNLDRLRAHGCLDGMSESDQMELFG